MWGKSELEHHFPALLLAFDVMQVRMYVCIRRASYKLARVSAPERVAATCNLLEKGTEHEVVSPPACGLGGTPHQCPISLSLSRHYDSSV